MAIRVFNNGKKLLKEKALILLKKVKREHCHLIGRTRPRSLTGKCSRNHGRYVGHGTCLLYRIVEMNPECRKCRSAEPINQLNFVFTEYEPFKRFNLRAELYFRKN